MSFTIGNHCLSYPLKLPAPWGKCSSFTDTLRPCHPPKSLVNSFVWFLRGELLVSPDPTVIRFHGMGPPPQGVLRGSEARAKLLGGLGRRGRRFRNRGDPGDSNPELGTDLRGWNKLVPTSVFCFVYFSRGTDRISWCQLLFSALSTLVGEPAIGTGGPRLTSE